MLNDSCPKCGTSKPNEWEKEVAGKCSYCHRCRIAFPHMKSITDRVTMANSTVYTCQIRVPAYLDESDFNTCLERSISMASESLFIRHEKFLQDEEQNSKKILGA